MEKLIGRSQNRMTRAGSEFHRYCENELRGYVGKTVSDYLVSRASKPTSNDASRLAFALGSLPKDATIEAVEHSLRYDLAETKVFGIVDLVLREKRGQIHIVDYKTGQSPRIFAEQLQLYALPYMNDSSGDQVRLTFALVDARRIVTWELRIQDAHSIRNKLSHLAALIEADTELRPRVGSQCNKCTFAGKCVYANRTPSYSPAATVKLTRIGKGSRNKVGGTGFLEEPNRYYVVFSTKDRVCDETGCLIYPKEGHYFSRSGSRLSIAGFRKRFPGIELPVKTLRPGQRIALEWPRSLDHPEH